QPHQLAVVHHRVDLGFVAAHAPRQVHHRVVGFDGEGHPAHHVVHHRVALAEVTGGQHALDAVLLGDEAHHLALPIHHRHAHDIVDRHLLHHVHQGLATGDEEGIGVHHFLNGVFGHGCLPAG